MPVPRLDDAGLTTVTAAINDPAVLARYRAKVATVAGSECLWWTGAVAGRSERERTDGGGHGRFSSRPGGRRQGSDQVTSQTTIPVGIYWKPGVWDLARSAYVADLGADMLDSPGSFVGWLAQALELHARRSPHQRAKLAAAGEKHPALVSVTRKSFNKKHDLPASTIEAVEDALVDDRQELGRMLARSAFAQEAVIAAAEEARRRLGRELPPPPRKLSNRPPRRRPAR